MEAWAKVLKLTFCLLQNHYQMGTGRALGSQNKYFLCGSGQMTFSLMCIISSSCQFIVSRASLGSFITSIIFLSYYDKH